MKAIKYLSLAWILSMPMLALAEPSVSSQEVQVMANALKYVIGLPPANEPLKILALYDPAKSESKAEAEAFLQQISASKIVKDRRLNLVTGTLQDVVSAKAPLLFVPKGFSAHYEEIAKLAKNNRLFPITTDKNCVVAKACPLSFSVGESVEIFLSEGALDASGFDIDAAFRLMARPI